jgi:hypothetical protein
MGVPLKTTTRRTVKSKTRKIVSNLIPGPPYLFEIPYNRVLHYHVVLNHIRSLVKRPGRVDLRIPRIAQPWRDAVLRDAPMLKGFFVDEPKWRDKLLLWCEKVLAKK